MKIYTFSVMMIAGLLAVQGLAAPDLTVFPAKVRGTVLRPDGETPVEDLRVRVWNAETEEVVFRTRTDSSGIFEVPRLDEGDHYITVGSVRIDMSILQARGGVTPQSHGVVVVVPKRAPGVQILFPTTLTSAALPQIVSP
jgi:hypothetical protein